MGVRDKIKAAQAEEKERERQKNANKPQPPPRTPSNGNGSGAAGPFGKPDGPGPFDILDQQADWLELLPDGNEYVQPPDGETLLAIRRPGASSHCSAKVMKKNEYVLVVHSTEFYGLPTGGEQKITRGRLCALLHHGGDEKAAAIAMLKGEATYLPAHLQQAVKGSPRHPFEGLIPPEQIARLINPEPGPQPQATKSQQLFAQVLAVLVAQGKTITPHQEAGRVISQCPNPDHQNPVELVVGFDSDGVELSCQESCNPGDILGWLGVGVNNDGTPDSSGDQQQQQDTSEPTEQSTAQTRFEALLLKVLDREGLRSLPPPEPLVEGWLFKDSLAWIQGKWGNAKSFLAIDLACCVSTGIDWHGMSVKCGTVLYLIAEGASGLSQRVDAWEQANIKLGPNIHFLPIPVRLADPEGVDVYAFGKLLEHFKPVLVIIDTQARVTVGAEENSSKDMGKFVDGLEYLREQAGTTMLVVHHEPRTGENLRGSVALEGAATSIIRSSKEGDLVTISCLKQKDVPEPQEIMVKLMGVGESAVLYPLPPGEHDFLTDNEHKIIDVLMEWPGFEARATQLKDASGLEKAFYRSANKLVKKGKLDRREEGRSVFYSIPEEDRPKPRGV